MEVISTYSEEIKNTDGAFKTSVEIYCAAVDFFIRVADREWDAVATVSSYRSSLANWETAGPAERGNRPGFPKAG